MHLSWASDFTDIFTLNCHCVDNHVGYVSGLTLLKYWAFIYENIPKLRATWLHGHKQIASVLEKSVDETHVWAGTGLLKVTQINYCWNIFLLETTEADVNSLAKEWILCLGGWLT